MNTINEEWRPVEGYEGLYEISNLGRVKSLNYKRTGVEKIMRPQKERNGYLRVQLCKDGKVKHFLVHRLVAEAFLPNQMDLPEVNHLDEDKANNVVTNIEWCNRLYNNNFGTRNKRSAASQINHPAKSKPVEASKYEDFREIELFFASTAEAGRNGYAQNRVSDCCNGCYCSKGNFYKNLYWRFAV